MAGKVMPGNDVCVPDVPSYALLAAVGANMLNQQVAELVATAFESVRDGEGVVKVTYCDPQALTECVKALVSRCFSEASEELAREVVEAIGNDALAEALKSILKALANAKDVNSLKASATVTAEIGGDGYTLTDMKAEAVRAAKVVMDGYARHLCLKGATRFKVAAQEEYVIDSEGAPVREGRLTIEVGVDARKLAATLLNPARLMAALIMAGEVPLRAGDTIPPEEEVANRINTSCGKQVCKAYELITGKDGTPYLYSEEEVAVYELTNEGLRKVAGIKEITEYVRTGKVVGFDASPHAVQALEEYLKARRRWERLVERLQP